MYIKYLYTQMIQLQYRFIIKIFEYSPSVRRSARRMRLEKALLFMLVPLIPAGGLLMLYNMAANASARSALCGRLWSRFPNIS